MGISASEKSMDGVFFERLIDVMKTTLRKSFAKKIPNLDEFHTSMTVKEGLVNNRPIHFVLAGNDMLPLTPNFLLFGRNLNLNNNSEILDPEDIKDPDYKLSDADSLELRGKKLKGIMTEISRRWQQEYLTALYEKDKLRQGSGPSTKFPT